MENFSSQEKVMYLPFNFRNSFSSSFCYHWVIVLGVLILLEAHKQLYMDGNKYPNGLERLAPKFNQDYYLNATEERMKNIRALKNIWFY